MYNNLTSNHMVMFRCIARAHLVYFTPDRHELACVANNETETNANCNNYTYTDASEETIKMHHKINDFKEFISENFKSFA